jgi:hypothetical protein
VAPPDVAAVFSAIVLGVENEKVGVAHEIQQFFVVAAVERFVVREKNNGAIRRHQTEAKSVARMIGTHGTDLNLPNGKVEMAQFLDLNIAGKLGERHRKKDPFHLACKSGFQSVASALASQNLETAA